MEHLGRVNERKQKQAEKKTERWEGHLLTSQVVNHPVKFHQLERFLFFKYRVRLELIFNLFMKFSWKHISQKTGNDDDLCFNL